MKELSSRHHHECELEAERLRSAQYHAVMMMCVLCRVKELSSRHHHECELEAERLRSAQYQAEKLLDTRERVNRERLKGLEDQVCHCFYSLYHFILSTVV